MCACVWRSRGGMNMTPLVCVWLRQKERVRLRASVTHAAARRTGAAAVAFKARLVETAVGAGFPPLQHTVEHVPGRQRGALVLRHCTARVAQERAQPPRVARSHCRERGLNTRLHGAARQEKKRANVRHLQAPSRAAHLSQPGRLVAESRHPPYIWK